ncbi:MAG: MBL fold metallo-hydrolase, partial [Bacteroidales bacterium]|nr:MBL fold metallo-hydrolase [Bacteroidales bacterium]
MHKYYYSINAKTDIMQAKLFIKHFIITLFLFMILPFLSIAQTKFEKDVFETSEGDLEITFIGHGTLMFRINGKVIHIDPVMREADYTSMPNADLICVTHEHGDHLDKKAISEIWKENTKFILNQNSFNIISKGKVLVNGDTWQWEGFTIKAVPAYNVENRRSNGEPFHPKGIGNGYVFTFGDVKVYVAGDTENIPEMKNLENIDVAFLPM